MSGPGGPTDPEALGLYVIRVEPHDRKREGEWALVAVVRPQTAWAQAVALASRSPRATVTVIEMQAPD